MQKMASFVSRKNSFVVKIRSHSFRERHSENTKTSILNLKLSLTLGSFELVRSCSERAIGQMWNIIHLYIETLVGR